MRAIRYEVTDYQMTGEDPNAKGRAIMAEVPNGATLIKWLHNIFDEKFIFYIEHESFENIAEGDDLPLYDRLIHSPKIEQDITTLSGFPNIRREYEIRFENLMCEMEMLTRPDGIMCCDGLTTQLVHEFKNAMNRLDQGYHSEGVVMIPAIKGQREYEAVIHSGQEGFPDA